MEDQNLNESRQIERQQILEHSPYLRSILGDDIEALIDAESALSDRLLVDLKTSKFDKACDMIATHAVNKGVLNDDVQVFQKVAQVALAGYETGDSGAWDLFKDELLEKCVYLDFEVVPGGGRTNDANDVFRAAWNIGAVLRNGSSRTTVRDLYGTVEYGAIAYKSDYRLQSDAPLTEEYVTPEKYQFTKLLLSKTDTGSDISSPRGTLLRLLVESESARRQKPRPIEEIEQKFKLSCEMTTRSIFGITADQVDSGLVARVQNLILAGYEMGESDEWHNIFQLAKNYIQPQCIEYGITDDSAIQYIATELLAQGASKRTHKDRFTRVSERTMDSKTMAPPVEPPRETIVTEKYVAPEPGEYSQH